MKKIITLLLLLVALLSLSACNKNNILNQSLLSEPSNNEDITSNESQIDLENSITTTTSRIMISAGDTVLYANLYDNQTAREFVELLPLKLDAFDRINLVKSTVLPQSISDDGEHTRNYSVGSIFYWPKESEVAFCYSDHLPETVVDIIHIGMIESNVEFFQDYTGEILIELANEVSVQTEQHEYSKNIEIMLGNTVVTAELDDSDIAKQFAALLPQTISMIRGSERVYYGGIDGTLTYDESDIQRTAEDGDLAYWFSGNSLALFFDMEKNSAVNSGVVVFGKITSDLSVFDDMESGEIMTVTRFE